MNIYSQTRALDSKSQNEALKDTRKKTLKQRKKARRLRFNLLRSRFDPTTVLRNTNLTHLSFA
jgi:hypothetical protein